MLGKEDVTSSCNLPMDCDGVQLGDSCVEESCVVLKHKELTLCERLGGKCVTSKRGRTNVKCIGANKEEDDDDDDDDGDDNGDDDIEEPEMIFDDKIIPLSNGRKRLRCYWRYHGYTCKGGGSNDDNYINDSDQSQSSSASGSQSTETESQSTETESQSTETESHSTKTESQSTETESQSTETESHSTETESQSTETESQSTETES